MAEGGAEKPTPGTESWPGVGLDLLTSAPAKTPHPQCTFQAPHNLGLWEGLGVGESMESGLVPT